MLKVLQHWLGFHPLSRAHTRIFSVPRHVEPLVEDILLLGRRFGVERTVSYKETLDRKGAGRTEPSHFKNLTPEYTYYGMSVSQTPVNLRVDLYYDASATPFRSAEGETAALPYRIMKIYYVSFGFIFRIADRMDFDTESRVSRIRKKIRLRWTRIWSVAQTTGACQTHVICLTVAIDDGRIQTIVGNLLKTEYSNKVWKWRYVDTNLETLGYGCSGYDSSHS